MEKRIGKKIKWQKNGRAKKWAGKKINSPETCSLLVSDQSTF
jgi:hypothetical protein